MASMWSRIARRVLLRQERLKTGLDDQASHFIEQFHLDCIDIDSDDGMAKLRQARGHNRADIAQPKKC